MENPIKMMVSHMIDEQNTTLPTKRPMGSQRSQPLAFKGGTYLSDSAIYPSISQEHSAHIHNFAPALKEKLKLFLIFQSLGCLYFRSILCYVKSFLYVPPEAEALLSIGSCLESLNNKSLRSLYKRMRMLLLNIDLHPQLVPINTIKVSFEV